MFEPSLRAQSTPTDSVGSSQDQAQAPAAGQEERTAQPPASTAPQTTDAGAIPSTPRVPIPAQTASPAPTDDITAIQQEVGERDALYLRTRVVYRYDYKLQDGDVATHRLRLKLLYAFGPNQRFGVSVLVPVIHKDTPTGSASGSGDTEVVTGANLYRTERFRTGVSFQVTFQTSSDDLLGGATTTIKPAWGFTAVLSRRFELTSAFYYKQSIHTVRGIPVKQFEPDITLNMRVLKATWFLEWDSFYDFTPAQFAQTLKTGLSRRVGNDHRWVASAYCAFPLNGYGRQTQYHLNPGLDVTWYPFKNR
jgi:hypothetical protein